DAGLASGRGHPPVGVHGRQGLPDAQGASGRDPQLRPRGRAVAASAPPPSPTRPVVLVTGLSGLIGSAFLAHEGAAYEVRGLNRRPVAGVVCHQADITDLDAIAPAFAGVDVVVHLAAVVGGRPSFDELLSRNIAGTYNVFECARRAGVRRVVYASSGNTVTAWEGEMPYRALVEGRYEELDGRPW